MEEGERKAGASRNEATPAPGSTTQSTPDHGAEKGRESADDDADKIDVCSDKFDPLFALYSPTVSIPFPKIKCFNNVSEYESFLKGGRGRAKPENVEKRRLQSKKGVADPERIERLKRLMVNNPVGESEGGESSSTSQRRRRKPQKNVLTRMPCMFSLNHCYYNIYKLHKSDNGVIAIQYLGCCGVVGLLTNRGCCALTKSFKYNLFIP